MTAHRVTAFLDQPIIGLVGSPFPLDGPLAWIAATLTDPGPITPDHAPDVDLPLTRWEQHGTWGWCASQAQYDPLRWTAIEIRRRPDATAFSRYTKVGKHHLGLGPHKARNLTVQATWAREIGWEVDTPTPNDLAALCGQITHLGKHTNLGYGRVTRWRVEPSTGEGWRDRPMPTPGLIIAVRPPYWHPTRRIAC